MRKRRLLGLALGFLPCVCAHAQAGHPCTASQVETQTEKGSICLPNIPHPLSWWTAKALSRDPSGDLMIGLKAADGLAIGLGDYKVRQTTTQLGVLSGYRVVQVLTFIAPGKRVIASGFGTADDRYVWKDLLIAHPGSLAFSALYSLHFDSGLQTPSTWKASVYGTGPNAILGTDDPAAGNGGTCSDGYWWFDREGPHPVDFGPLLKAVAHAIPAGADFTERCWALHPESSRLISWVRKSHSKCRTCDGLGTVTARYQVEEGVAQPVSIHFEPGAVN